jgi:hypothetical protein
VSAVQAVVVNAPPSPLHMTLSGKLPTAPETRGKKFKPIHVRVKLTNSDVNLANETVTVQLFLSPTAGETGSNPAVATLRKKVKIKSNKSAGFGTLTIKNIPPDLSGTLHVVAQLTDQNGAVDTADAGQITVAA